MVVPAVLFSLSRYQQSGSAPLGLILAVISVIHSTKQTWILQTYEEVKGDLYRLQKAVDILILQQDPILGSPDPAKDCHNTTMRRNAGLNGIRKMNSLEQSLPMISK